jgi:hypothetical protein
VLFQIISDTLGDSFLILQPSCMHVNDSSQFADANNPINWDISNMSTALERL